MVGPYVLGEEVEECIVTFSYSFDIIQTLLTHSVLMISLFHGSQAVSVGESLSFYWRNGDGIIIIFYRGYECMDE